MEEAIKVERTNLRFTPDRNRVLARFNDYGSLIRAENLIRKIESWTEQEVKQLLTEIIERFAHRHTDVKRIFKDNYNLITKNIETDDFMSLDRKLLIGSYFTMEYSIESAALFNPSIVPLPGAPGMEDGELRVALTFRAVGEGHVSSIVFRSGIIRQNNDIDMDPSSATVEVAKIKNRSHYSKEVFITTLQDRGFGDMVPEIENELIDDFTFDELNEVVGKFKAKQPLTERRKEFAEILKWIADSNYDLSFVSQSDISGRVIFPVSGNERKGLEDARFVHFHQGDLRYLYYATYTAYNGRSFVPQLIETRDFRNFNVSTLHGNGCRNKGMALFPEKINDKYVMLSRNDGENIFIMFSDNIKRWENPVPIRRPKHKWDLVQLGNCGSPLKTEKGWLALTHGVGPVRTYAMGAILLDIDNPEKVVAELKDPLIFPNESERNGYVPNVVYSCGCLVHNNTLFIPYAMSDSISSFAKLPLDRLIDAMQPV